MNKLTDDLFDKNHENDIDLQELFLILFQGKWIIISLTAFASIIGVIYSLYLPNVYQSEALLAPVNSSKNTSGALGGYASLAGLAGIQFPSAGGESNSSKAIEKLNSLSFFENNILPYIFLPNLMALESWEPQANKLIYDDSIYKIDTNSWVRVYSHPKKQIPTAQESFKVFKEEHLDVSLNPKSGFLNLKIKHQSPYVAKQWAELLINQVNSFYRMKDKSESEKAVSYLNQQIKLTSLSEVKESIAQLLQNETKKLTLIEANQSYVYEYIDPPAVMEKKSEPSRAIIVILSALLGGVISILLVFIRHFSSNTQKY
jgi:LPS O-antigen subunit length determinant protein (WzzB/FepE family)